MQWLFNALGGRKNTNTLLVFIIVAVTVSLKVFVGVDIPWEYLPWIIGVPAVAAIYFIKKEGEIDLENVRQTVNQYRDEVEVARKWADRVDDLFDDQDKKDEAQKRLKEAVREHDEEKKGNKSG
jgi:hypothetical protein